MHPRNMPGIAHERSPLIQHEEAGDNKEVSIPIGLVPQHLLIDVCFSYSNSQSTMMKIREIGRNGRNWETSLSLLPWLVGV